MKPKAQWGWVKAMLHSVYDQPDAEAAHAQFDRLLDAISGKLPTVAEHSDAARPQSWLSPPSPELSGARSGRTTRKNASTAKSAAPTSSASSPTGKA